MPSIVAIDLGANYNNLNCWANHFYREVTFFVVFISWEKEQLNVVFCFTFIIT